MDSHHGKARRRRHGRGFGLATAAKFSIFLLKTFLFLRLLQAKRRADERTRTADLISLRVIGHVLQGFAEAWKSSIPKRFSLLWFAACCTVLRSRWYQSGIKPPLSECCFSVTWVSVFLVEQTSARWSREPEKRHQLSCRGRAGTVRPDGGRGGAVPNQMNPPVFCYLCG